jgi:hypothetical protein
MVVWNASVDAQTCGWVANTDPGIITEISGRSRHYKPSFGPFIRSLEDLQWAPVSASAISKSSCMKMST